MSTGLPRMAAITGLMILTAVAAAAQAEPPASVTHTHATSAPAALESSGLDDAWMTIEPEFPDDESRIVKRRSSKGSVALLGGKSEQTARPWARTLGALAGVVGLIVFLTWGYRAITGTKLPLLGKTRRPELIEVISRTSLSARQSLCLVRIGSRLVLIGQSQETLRALDVIDDAELAAQLVGAAARKRPDSSRAEFQRCLEREAEGYQHPADSIDETVIPDARRIADVRQGVTNTIQRIRRAVAQA